MWNFCEITSNHPRFFNIVSRHNASGQIKYSNLQRIQTIQVQIIQVPLCKEWVYSIYEFLNCSYRTLFANIDCYSCFKGILSEL